MGSQNEKSNPWKRRKEGDLCGGIKMEEKLLVAVVGGVERRAGYRKCRGRWECWTAEWPMLGLLWKTKPEAMEWLDANATSYRWEDYKTIPGGKEGE